MLLALRLSNFAVVEQAELAFERGLTVLTGETGAGKSMLVDALGLVLGGKADADAVRAGCDEAIVEAVVEAGERLRARVVELGLPDLGDEVSVRRTIGRTGRGKAYVNGSLVSVGVLAKLLRGCVDVAGQHEHVGLFDPAVHRELLDGCGDDDAELRRYSEVWIQLRSLIAKQDALGGDEGPWKQRLDLLRFQLEELERLDPAVDEEAQLEAQRRRLGSVERLKELIGASVTALGEDGAALDRIARAQQLLLDAIKIDPSLGASAPNVESARVMLQDALTDLERYVEGLEGDPKRLLDIEDRLDALRRCAKRLGVEVGALVGRRASLALEVEQLTQRDAIRAQLEVELAAARATLLRAGEALSERRRATARRLESSIRRGLAELALPHARIEFRFGRAAAPRADGLDEIELFFAANPGEPMRPIARACSGGEASRVLLALKASLLASDPSGTCVFDEVDAGVSGAVAEAVGRLIRDVSAHRQVLCITHLPQVAAFADHHVRVEKTQHDGRVFSRWSLLSDPGERTQELARMLSGAEVTREAIDAAQALFRSVRARPKAVRAARRSKESAPQRGIHRVI